MKKISIVLPCHNEAKNLPFLIPEIVKKIPKRHDYEIICVNDSSTDETWEAINKIATKNKRVKGVSFYRRSGHQSALVAGISYSSGNSVITMDADFQHPPKLIPKIISYWERGYDMVQLQKNIDQTSSIISNILRSIGYQIWKSVSNGVLSPGVSDFRIIDRGIVEFILQSSEKEIFLRGITNLASRKSITLKYNVGKRKYGKSSYTIGMFLNMFVNGFISFSTKPLRIASLFGLILSFSTGAFLLFDTIRSLIFHQSIIQGWTTVVFLMLILNGFIIFYMGVLGEYIGVIFKEVKNRPNYLVDKTINL